MLTFNNKAIKIGSGHTWISNTYIPQNTMRFQMLGWDDGNGNIDTTKTKVTLADLESYTTSGAGTWRQVGTDVFDFTKANTSWGNNSGSILNNLFIYTPEGGSATPLLQHYHFNVIDADLTGVTSIRSLFASQLIHRCKLSNTSSVDNARQAFQWVPSTGVADTLEYVDALNLSSVTTMESMFSAANSSSDLGHTRKLEYVGDITTSSSMNNIKQIFLGCNKLKRLPDISDISGLRFSYRSGSNFYYDYEQAFYNCSGLENGILAMYNKFATAEKRPITIFFGCGLDTAAGTAEMAQVPAAWGGKLVSIPSTVAAKTFRVVSQNKSVGDQLPDSELPAAQTDVTTYTAIDAYNGLWDVTIDSTSFNKNARIVASLTAITAQGDCSGVTSCATCFNGRTNITSVCSLSFPDCTSYSEMFRGCTALTAVPSINTDVATNTSKMFYGCTAVESGALALYNQASTQTTPPTTHTDMFTHCGSGTTTGAAELALIPGSWGGLGA